MNGKKYAAEAIGTFWLTFAGCGGAVIAAAFPQVGIGLVGVSLAFGLSVVTMAYAIGHVSGCHLNPAVTVGLVAGGRFPAGQIAPYVIAQVIGAVAASALLYVIASGAPGFDVGKGFASNGYDAHSPGHPDDPGTTGTGSPSARTPRRGGSRKTPAAPSPNAPSSPPHTAFPGRTSPSPGSACLSPPAHRSHREKV